MTSDLEIRSRKRRPARPSATVAIALLISLHAIECGLLVTLYDRVSDLQVLVGQLIEKSGGLHRWK